MFNFKKYIHHYISETVGRGTTSAAEGTKSHNVIRCQPNANRALNPGQCCLYQITHTFLVARTRESYPRPRVVNADNEPPKHRGDIEYLYIYNVIRLYTSTYILLY